mmetsp:Transcript_10198/g.27735  ORF Transcript_10198/g.27735 Transcript_10198/m.27735 type:complete len:272 (+) Transcript_10198:597-1412(+)
MTAWATWLRTCRSWPRRQLWRQRAGMGRPAASRPRPPSSSSTRCPTCRTCSRSRPWRSPPCSTARPTAAWSTRRTCARRARCDLAKTWLRALPRPCVRSAAARSRPPRRPPGPAARACPSPRRRRSTTRRLRPSTWRSSRACPHPRPSQGRARSRWPRHSMPLMRTAAAAPLPAQAARGASSARPHGPCRASSSTRRREPPARRRGRPRAAPRSPARAQLAKLWRRRRRRGRWLGRSLLLRGPHRPRHHPPRQRMPPSPRKARPRSASSLP